MFKNLRYYLEILTLYLDQIAKSFAIWASNLVISTSAFGGVYITGGVALKQQEYYLSEKCVFMKHFVDKGRFSNLLKDTPVYFITREIGLEGAEQYGIQAIKNEY